MPFVDHLLRSRIQRFKQPSGVCHHERGNHLELRDDSSRSLYSRHAVSCPSISTCYATDGFEVIETTDSGATWTNQSNLFNAFAVRIQGFWCPSTTSCDATGEGNSSESLYVSTTSATSFTAEGSTPGLYLWCASSSSCISYGYDSGISTTTNSGSSWNTQTLPPDVGDLGQLVCTSMSSCQAIGFDSGGEPQYEATSDGGTTWTTDSISQLIPSLESISCAPGSEDCMAAANSTVFSPSICGPSDCYIGSPHTLSEPAVSTDGGATWTRTSLLPVDGQVVVNDISCVGSSDCLLSLSSSEGEHQCGRLVFDDGRRIDVDGSDPPLRQYAWGGLVRVADKLLCAGWAWRFCPRDD